LRGSFLLADTSPVDEVVQPGSLNIVGIEIEAVPLFGHSPGQLGYVVGDVFFCADVVLPASVLDKYRVPYLFSLGDHLAALQRARDVNFRVAVPGHGAALDVAELAELIDLNAELAERVLDAVLEIVETPQTADVVLQQLLCRFGAPVSDAPSFYLLQPTALAFLSHLHREGRVSNEISDGQSLWVRA
jgi:glyoxylase-like metal-dependent hydrolase (beta-lactamase superfamily II)